MRGLQNAEGEEAKAAALEQIMEVIMPLEDAFAKCGKGKDFFGGDTIGYLDIALGSFLGWLRVTEKLTNIKILDESKTPGLFGWAHRFGSNAGKQRSLWNLSRCQLPELKPSNFPIALSNSVVN
ncbi:hypothetical protein RHGRI_033607 [Rhododendron griersonianum]|uniref:Glutathione S-transferase n=1 Tax=Rhododendron griersonianum TaxID=479676 RepID=A0AAV6HXE4_9ERIC|nr:hypothetical protein RHGRI_033607 [Rhododendron griersonianum]